jgi:hypothetical protein
MQASTSLCPPFPIALPSSLTLSLASLFPFFILLSLPFQTILAADIGGTNTRLDLIAIDPNERKELHCGQMLDFPPLIRHL